MIRQFKADTALLLIDAQEGVDVLSYWGGPHGRRNNPDAELNQHALLTAWRAKDLAVFYTMHDSREAGSPLKVSLDTGRIKRGLEPMPHEVVVRKDVNSGFIGTSLEILLRRGNCSRLVIAGFFTNMCVETTARMAGNMGFDTYVCGDACATTNRLGADGTDYDADLVHAMTLANLHREFATVLRTADALVLLGADAAHLARSQGNE